MQETIIQRKTRRVKAKEKEKLLMENGGGGPGGEILSLFVL